MFFFDLTRQYQTVKTVGGSCSAALGTWEMALRSSDAFSMTDMVSAL